MPTELERMKTQAQDSDRVKSALSYFEILEVKMGKFTIEQGCGGGK